MLQITAELNNSTIKLFVSSQWFKERQVRGNSEVRYKRAPLHGGVFIACFLLVLSLCFDLS
jgi:hypothetical protein